LRIAVVAGESSGDLLGGGLLAAVEELWPGVVFEGVAGPRMATQGCRVLAPADRLSVMGLAEVLRHLPGLLRLRRRLVRHWLAAPPDAFVGIDSPDFNLPLERVLKRAGVPTAHYVSPSVWAWRQYRVRRMRECVDLVLTLFPFEAQFYEQHAIPVRFVGHPLAAVMPPPLSQGDARSALGLPREGTIAALLPGSRSSEIRYLAEPFLRAARWSLERRPQLHFVSPTANAAVARLFAAARVRYAPDLPLTLVEGRSIEAMVAADVVLAASGTASLEAMLIPRPMVVAYRLSPVTFQILRRLVKVPCVALPNLLAGCSLVPEFLQQDATPENLGAAVLACLDHPEGFALQAREFARVHHELKRDSDKEAAEAVLELIARKRQRTLAPAGPESAAVVGSTSNPFGGRR
jgi:lipid-A-disaccharide synthase